MLRKMGERLSVEGARTSDTMFPQRRLHETFYTCCCPVVSLLLLCCT